MLRRKLIIIFGALVFLLLATAVGAIWSLQGVLSQLQHLRDEAWVTIEATNNLGTEISLIEIEIYDLGTGRTRHLDALIDLMDHMERQLVTVQRSYIAHLPDSQNALERIERNLPLFGQAVGALGTAQDPDWAARCREKARSIAVSLRQDIMRLNRNVRQHGEEEQTDLTRRFQWTILALTVVFIIVINIAIVVLLRMSAMVVKPVEQLVEATRQLGQERFDYRVDLEQHDEFDQLAGAYNALAAQLQANEQRKLEMLGQVALTLNHELNNAIAIIELQLQLLSRQAGGNTRIEKCAHEIQQCLSRMTSTVEALKRVRRIVLTDYTAGVKMLDLQRSVES